MVFGIASGMHSASVVHYLTYVMEDPNLSGYVLVVSYAGDLHRQHCKPAARAL